jgi:hypothetical protein
MHSDEDPKPDPSLEALAARLRALPEPPMPANLEARLLAAVSTLRPAHVTSVAASAAANRQGWFAVACAVGAIAAACLVAILITGKPDNSLVTQTTPVDLHSVSNAFSTADELGGISLSPVDRRILQGAGLSTFRWPVGRIPSAGDAHSIPRDLLD